MRKLLSTSPTKTNMTGNIKTHSKLVEIEIYLPIFEADGDEEYEVYGGLKRYPLVVRQKEGGWEVNEFVLLEEIRDHACNVKLFDELMKNTMNELFSKPLTRHLLILSVNNKFEN